MSNEFVDKIVIWHSEKVEGIKSQRIEIHYKLIGYVSLKDKIGFEEKAS
ncbi:MAG: DUF4368 domain-containing protein [Oscillospiraceae bacterium]|jgi:hypothetical protein|nr:DUF4368 domain-containing protein [Oscillospiraceae bacterium]